MTFSPCDSILFLQVLETLGIILGASYDHFTWSTDKGKMSRTRSDPLQGTHKPRGSARSKTTPDSVLFSLFLLFSSPTSKPTHVQLFSAVDFAYSWLCISAGFTSLSLTKIENIQKKISSKFQKAKLALASLQQLLHDVYIVFTTIYIAFTLF